MDVSMKAFFTLRSIPLLAFILVLGLASEPAFAICGSGDVAKATNDRTDCIPAKVCQILQSVAAQFGKVQVKSGYRSPGDNERRGGAGDSMHIYCRAADFWIPNHESRNVQDKLKSFLKGQKGKGTMRYNVYCTGRAHVDNSNRSDNYNTWPDCGKKKTGRYKRKRLSRRGRR